MDDLCSLNTNLSSVETIGYSFEKRPLKLIKIGTQTKDANGKEIEKPIIWIDAGLDLGLTYY